MSDQEVRRVLEARLERVRADLQALEDKGKADAGSRPQYGKRVGDHISEALEQRRNVAATHSLANEEKELVRALEKLDAGTYDICDRCQGPVGEERLEALPWATLCITCKRAAERPRR